MFSRAHSRKRLLKGELPPSLLALGLVVVAIVVLPLAVTLFQAATADMSQVRASLQGTDINYLILRTLLVAIIVTPLCGVFGVAGAWFVERTDMRFSKGWALLLIAPLAIPLFITSYAWSALGSPFQGFLGAVGIVAFSYYPIVFLLSAASLRNMDPTLEESAQSLGCSTWQIFWRIVFPQLRPALLGGLLVIALDTLVEFDAFVGIHYSLFVFNIYDQYRISFSASGAAVLSMFSVGMCLIALAVEVLLRRGANYVSVRRGTQRPALRYRLGAKKLPLTAAMAIFVAAAVGIPVGMLLSWLLQATPQGLASAPAGIGQLLPATATSLILGLGSALVGLLLALPIAVMVTRYRSWRTTLLERGTYLSFALPDLVAAVALSYLMSRLAPALYGNVVVLIAAYAMLFTPIAVLGLRVSFAQIDRRLEDTARALGCAPLRAWLRVGLPLAKPGIVAATVLVFAFVLSDLSTTQVLLPAGMVTLGTQFWSDANAVALGAAAPYAAVLVILAMGATYILMSRFGRVRLAAVTADTP